MMKIDKISFQEGDFNSSEMEAKLSSKEQVELMEQHYKAFQNILKNMNVQVSDVNLCEIYTLLPCINSCNTTHNNFTSCTDLMSRSNYRFDD